MNVEPPRSFKVSYCCKDPVGKMLREVYVLQFDQARELTTLIERLANDRTRSDGSQRATHEPRDQKALSPSPRVRL